MAKLTLSDVTAGYLSATTYNANNALIETALENTLSRDGTSPNTMSASLDMNNNRIVNLPNASNNTEPVTLGQAASIQSFTGVVATAGSVGAVLWPQTAAETSAGVTPTNYYYEPGNVLRYGTNTTPGTTDMTTAIDNAIASNGGGVVYVPSGTYSVTGITAGTANVKMALEPGAIIKLANSSNTSVITSTAAGFTIDGGEIDGNRANQSGTSHGVLASGDNLTIKNCYIHGCLNNGIKGTDGDNWLIQGNYLTDVVQTGILASSSLTADKLGLMVINNFLDFTALSTSQANGGIKVHADSSGTYEVVNATIQGNIVKLAQNASMPANAVCIETLYNCPSASIVGNTTEGGSIGITVGDAPAGYISGNTCTAAWNIGLEVAGATTGSVGATLDGNTVRGDTLNTDVGVSISGTVGNNQVSGNVINDAEVDGVKLQNSDASAVTGNTVTLATGATRGIRLILSDQVTISGNLLDGNSVASSVAMFLDSCSDASITGNTIVAFTNGLRVTDATTDGHTFDNMVVIGNRFGNTGADITTGFGSGGWGSANIIHNMGIEPRTFGSGDTTPSVVIGNVFKTGGADTYTDFDDGFAGKEITVISKHAAVFDTTGTSLTGSSVDLTTASGDVTRWVCEDGSTWRLIGFVDASVDNSGGA